ncbi:MAG: GAF domain-containing protein [Anaerolineales bacterium]
MSERRRRQLQKSDPQHFLGRFIRVWDAEGNEERLGTIFNLALLAGLTFTLLAAVGLLLMGSLISGEYQRLFILLFTALSVGLHLALFRVSKGGRLPVATRLYTLGFYILVALSVIIGGGATSTFWVIFLWPLVLSVIFLSRRLSIGLLVGALLLWGGLHLLEILGLYTPLLRSATLQPLLFLVFFLIIASMSVFVLSYTVRYLEDTRAAVVASTMALEVSQRALETQVEERTREARRFADQLQAIQDLNQVIVLSPNLQELLERAAELAAERFGAYRAGIFLMDRAREWLVLEASWGLQGVEGLQLRVGEQGIVGRAAALRDAYVVSDVAEDAYYLAIPELAESRSAVAVPILGQNEVLGVLLAESQVVGAFDKERVQILRAVANVLAVAIENAQRIGELESRVERLSRYEEQDLVEQWRHSLAREGGRLRYLYDRIQVAPLRESEAGQKVLASLQGEGGGAQSDELTTFTRDGSYFLVAPVKVRGQVLGRFVFESDRPWTEGQMEVVDAVVTQLGLALENARLLADTRRRALFEQTAGQVTRRIRSQVEIEAVLEEALKELSQLLGADRASARMSLAERGQEELR